MIDRFAGEHGFSGVVAFGHRGRIEEARAFGLADLATRTPVRPSTTFRLGSISKWLTAIAVLRLVERRQMALAAPIGRYLPELGSEFAAVPLEHLLANNSGIPDLIAAAVKAEPGLRDSRAGSAEMVRRFSSGALAFPPGARFDYSFFNWVLLHAAIERVTAKPFAAVIADEVFRPARMGTAGFIDTVHPSSSTVALAFDKSGAPKPGLVPPFGGASGNVHAGAADLVALAHAVFAGRLLRPESVAELIRIRVPEERYALGGRVRDVGGRPWAWETGKVGGYRSHLAHDISGDRTFVVFNNQDMEQDVIGKLVEDLIRTV